MKILFGSLFIFFGTLLAAGLVALGQPSAMDVVPHAASSASPGASTSAAAETDDDPSWERLLVVRGFH